MRRRIVTLALAVCAGTPATALPQTRPAPPPQLCLPGEALERPTSEVACAPASPPEAVIRPEVLPAGGRGGGRGAGGRGGGRGNATLLGLPTVPPTAELVVIPPASASRTKAFDIEVDEFGRPLNGPGTADRPAYVETEVSVVAKSDKPLMLRIAGKTPADPALIVKPLPTGDGVRFTREMLDMYAKAGVVNVELLRDDRVLSTLRLILRSWGTILLNENGPVDPQFGRSAGAVYLPMEPTFEYASAVTNPPPPPTLRLEAPAIVRRIGAMPVSTLAVDLPLNGRPRAIPWASDLNVVSLDVVSRDDTAVLAVVRDGRGIATVSLTRVAKDRFPVASYMQIDNGARIYEVEIDRTGVTNLQFLNRRRPPVIPDDGQAFLRFRNRMNDRTAIVTVRGIVDNERAELLRNGVEVTNCRGGSCEASVRIYPNDKGDLPLTPLRAVFVKNGVGSLMTFTVTFFEDETTPTNSRGYVSFTNAAHFAEAGTSTTWTAGLTGAVAADPDLSLKNDQFKKPEITFASPWKSGQRWHGSGSATIGLKQSLGTRADAEFELTGKKGDFGPDVSNFQASKFLASIYSIYGSILTAGRFEQATLTNSIALNESGEGVSLTAPLLMTRTARQAGELKARIFGATRVSGGRIFKRQLPAGSFTADDVVKAQEAGARNLEKINGTWIGQVRDIWLGSLRASFIGVRGDATRALGIPRDKADTTSKNRMTPYSVDYWTAGSDLFFAAGDVSVTGGAYYSQRSSKDVPATLVATDGDRKGGVGLVTVSYTNPDGDASTGSRRETNFIVTGTYGHGGNYVGESQAFAPDVLFLSTFLSALREPRLPVGPGLTNKHYVGAGFTVPRKEWAQWVVSWIPGLKDDIDAASISLKMHHYRFAHFVDRDNNLGTEESVDVKIDSPKGVKYQIVFAAFHPGKALTGDETHPALLTGTQYTFKAQVSVRFDP